MRLWSLPTRLAEIPLTTRHIQPNEQQQVVPLGPVPMRRVLPAHERKEDFGLTDEDKRAQHDAAMEALHAGKWKPWERLGLVEGDADGPSPDELKEPTPANDDKASPASITTRPDAAVWNDLNRTVSLLEPAMQFAHPLMTCTFPNADAVIRTRGLVPGGEQVELSLPGHDVLVVVEAAGHHDVCMEIDTLLIDTELAQVAVTWRGQVPEDLMARSDVRLIVALVPQDDVPELEDVYRSLPHGHFSRAQLPSDVQTPKIARRDVALSVARRMTFDRVPDPLLKVDDYAAIAAQISAQPKRRTDILAAHDFEDGDWALEERAWLGRVGEALKTW